MTYVANKWFPDSERAFATALLVVGSPIGVGVSYGMIGGFFADVDAEADIDKFMLIFKQLMLAHLIIAVVFWIVFNASIKEKPDTPPSAVAEV